MSQVGPATKPGVKKTLEYLMACEAANAASAAAALGGRKTEPSSWLVPPEGEQLRPLACPPLVSKIKAGVEPDPVGAALTAKAVQAYQAKVDFDLERQLNQGACGSRNFGWF